MTDDKVIAYNRKTVNKGGGSGGTNRGQTPLGVALGLLNEHVKVQRWMAAYVSIIITVGFGTALFAVLGIHIPHQNEIIFTSVIVGVIETTRLSSVRPIVRLLLQTLLTGEILLFAPLVLGSGQTSTVTIAALALIFGGTLIRGVVEAGLLPQNVATSSIVRKGVTHLGWFATIAGGAAYLVHP